jgi:hypothetical protein
MVGSMMKILLLPLFLLSTAYAQFELSPGSSVFGSTFSGIVDGKTVYIAGQNGYVGDAVFVEGEADLTPTTISLRCVVVRHLGVQGNSSVLRIEKSSGGLSPTSTALAGLMYPNFKQKNPLAVEMAFKSTCDSQYYGTVYSQSAELVYVPIDRKLSLRLAGKIVTVGLTPDDNMYIKPTIELK